MMSMFGLAPKGMMKRNAVALIVVLDFVFRDDVSDLKITPDQRRKVIDGKLLQLLCLVTRVIRIGGMMDDDAKEITRNLFKNFLVNSPEHLRQHHEGMLAKGNEDLYS